MSQAAFAIHYNWLVQKNGRVLHACKVTQKRYSTPPLFSVSPVGHGIHPTRMASDLSPFPGGKRSGFGSRIISNVHIRNSHQDHDPGAKIAGCTAFTHGEGFLLTKMFVLYDKILNIFHRRNLQELPDTRLAIPLPNTNITHFIG
jgi:hypothetical protein